MTDKQTADIALRILLGAVGIDRTKAILSEVIVEFRKHTPSNADAMGCAERAFAFGPDLLVRAREVEQGDAMESAEQR
jgi:hypothetical protein